MNSDRRGTDKNHPGQNFLDKRPPDKTSGQKPPRTIEREFVQGTFVRVFILGLLKIGGSEMCDVLFFGVVVGGVPGCVAKCDMGRGVKNGQK